MSTVSVSTPLSTNKVRAWIVVILCLFASACAEMGLHSLTPIMKELLKELSLPTTYGGSLSSLFIAINAICTLPVGFLIFKWGAKKIGVTGLSILTIGLIFGVFSSNPASLLLARVIQGAGYTCCLVVGPSLINQWFTKEESSLPLGIYTCATGVGQMTINYTASYLMPFGGWRAIWIFAAVASIICLILFILLAKQGPILECSKKKNENHNFLEAAKNPSIWMLAAIYLSYSIGLKGFQTFQKMIFTTQAGVSDIMANNLATIGSFGIMIAGFIAGFLFNKFKKHRGKIFISYVILGMIVIVLGFKLNSPGAALAFACVYGWLTCAIGPMCMILLPQKVISPVLIPASIAILLTFGKFCGGMLGPMVISLAQTIGGSWQSASIPVMICGIITVTCAILVGLPLDKEAKNNKAANLPC